MVTDKAFQELGERVERVVALLEVAVQQEAVAQLVVGQLEEGLGEMEQRVYSRFEKNL
jgi:hypothetical protein